MSAGAVLAVLVHMFLVKSELATSSHATKRHQLLQTARHVLLRLL